MGKAVKVVLVTAAIVVIAAIVLATVLLSNLDRIVKQVVETQGTEALGTPLTLDSASISLRSASGELEGLEIANPPGFESSRALELGRIRIAIETASLGGDEIVLREVDVDGARLSYEQRGETSNLQTILDHLDQGQAASSEGAEGPEIKEKRLVVETFRLHGAQVTVLHERLAEPLELQLDDVVLHDVGRVGAGVTASSAARQILEPVLQRTLDAARARLRDELEEGVRREVDRRKEEAVKSLQDKLLGKD